MKPWGAIFPLLALGFCGTDGLAASVSWTGSGDGDFANAANWSALPTDDLVTDLGSFSGVPTPFQPTVFSNRAISGLAFETPGGGWTLGGNATLTLGAAGVFSLGQPAGSNLLAAQFALGSTQTWQVGTGGALRLIGSLRAGEASAPFAGQLIVGGSNAGDLILDPQLGHFVALFTSQVSAGSIQVNQRLRLGFTSLSTSSVNTISNAVSAGIRISNTGLLDVRAGEWRTNDLGSNNTGAFTGTLNISGGTLATGGARYLGQFSGAVATTINLSGGTLLITGGGNVMANAGHLGLGAHGANTPSGTLQIHVTGGLLEVARGAGNFPAGSGITSAAMSLGGLANTTVLVNQSGGTVRVGVTPGSNVFSGVTNSNSYTNLSIGSNFAANNAAYTLTDGTLLVAGSIQGLASAGGVSNFNFLGGTLSVGAFTATHLGYSPTATSSGNQTAESLQVGALVNRGGTVAPGGAGTAGRTSITGSYLVQSGALAIDLSGTTQASAFQTGQYDHLSVSGTTTLGGQLVVNVLPGFTPAAGNTFTILSSNGTLSGSFTNVTFGGRLRSADGLHTFVVSQVGNTITLAQYLPVTAPILSVASTTSTAMAGDTVVLAVNATSLVPVTYQWFKNNVAIPGATSSSLTLLGLQNADVGSYSVVATNAAGTATQTFPLVITNPVSTGSVVVPAGGAQTFSATPSATSFVWKLDGVTVGTNSPTFNYVPETNAVGTHALQLKETYSDASIITRQWSVRVSLVLPTSPVQYYVSPTGVDTNNGSLGSPFRTLEKARDAVRLLPRPLAAGGVTVFLRGGTHFRTSTFSLGTSDSGTATAPIIYTSYPGETAIISGGKPVLSSQFTPLASSEVSRVTSGVDTTRIWEADMTALGLTRKGPFPNTYNEWQIYNVFGVSSSAGTIELFYNGKRMHLARFPNHNPTDDNLTTNLKMNGVAPGAATDGSGYLNGAGNYTDSNGNVIAVGGAFQYNTTDESHISRWQSAMAKGGVWVVGYWRVPWQINGGKVALLDTGSKKTIALVPNPSNANNPLVSGGIGYKYSRPVGNKAEPWWVVNLLEELDQPGEWCMDFSRNKIYFLMDAAGAPPDNSVVLSDLATAQVQISGSYVNFQGVTFEHGLSQGVQVLGGSRNLVVDCTFRNMGGYGVDLNNLSGGNYNGVVSCDMSEMASGGVIARGGNNTASPRVPTNNFIVNNRIKDYSRVVRVYAAAIDAGYQYGRPAVGIRIAHNQISGSPHGGILWKDYDHTIEYNEVSDYCQFSNDFGGIYTFNPNYISNTVIRYNYLHDSDHGEGIYFDSDHINATTYGNVVNLKTLSTESRGTGFYDQVPSGALTPGVPYTDTLFNNIAVNCRTGFQIYSDLGGKIENNLNYRHYSTSYKWNRITVGTSSISTSSSSADVLGSGPNLSYTTDPGFLDFNNDDFRLRPDAKAYLDLPNFEPIPLEMAGLYNDEYRSDAKIHTPFIVTKPATNIGGNTATLNATLAYPQFERNATVRLYWGTTDGGTDPLDWQNVLDLGTPGSGTVSQTLTALSPGTRYSFRFYAINTAREDWAEQSNSFITYPLASVATDGSATASSETSPAGNAFDASNATSWQSGANQTTGSLQYQFANDAALRVTQYQITSSPDSPAKDPRDWQFLGSFDGIIWVTLDTRTGETFASRGMVRTFNFVNKNAYRFYQLNITANNGDPSGVQLAEFQLFAPQIVADTTGPVITTPGNLTASGTSAGATVTFEVSAVDAVSGNAVATASPASGTFFNVGNTTVTVSATDAAGNTSTATFTVTVTAPALPAPWTIRQIAPYSGVTAGAATAPTATSFTITGRGGASTGGTTGDIWTGNNDSFTYLSQPWTGDGTFTARVASFTSTDSSAKAGIMFRETTNQGSRYSATYLLRKGDAWAQHKTATSGSSTNTNFFTANSTGKGIPYWVRLVRTGNTFSNFISPDGVTWTQLGSARTNTLSGTALTVGFAVAPRTGNTTATVTFDNISFLAPLVAPTGISANADNARIVLSWNTVPTAATYTVKRSLTPGGPYTSVTSGLTATTFLDAAVANGTAYYYIVTAINLTGESPASAETSATPLSALQTWRDLYFSSIDNTGDAADTANPENDERNNLLEYALGGDPLIYDRFSPLVTLNPQGRLQLTFTRLRSDLTYSVQGSDDLITWTTLATNPGTLGQSTTYTDTSANPRRFLRLRVTTP